MPTPPAPDPRAVATSSRTASKGPYRAAVFDLDGTLLADTGTVVPATRAVVNQLLERGIVVMIATGRSEVSTLPVARDLGLETPTVIYNGAALLCPKTGGLLACTPLSGDHVERSLGFAAAQGAFPVVMADGRKHVPDEQSPTGNGSVARDVVRLMHGVHRVPTSALPLPETVRVSLFSDQFDRAEDLEAEYVRFMAEDLYLTSFALRLLPGYRDSDIMVLDIHAPCPGKRLALDVLTEQYGIAPEEVVAFGDAGNDLPLLEAAGLGIAMGNAAAEIQARAHRTIGHNDTNTLAETLTEIFKL